jgi:hypothetical protein
MGGPVAWDMMQACLHHEEDLLNDLGLRIVRALEARPAQRPTKES